MGDVELADTIVDLLAELPGWERDPDPVGFPADGVAVYYGRIRSTPDRGVGVRVYGGTEAVALEPGTKRVQIRLRGAIGDEAGADALGDEVHAALHGLSRLGEISGISRTSFSPLGADGNGREERTENYLIILDNPEASQ